jgi:CRP-like cAMP-binding protein
MDLAASFLANPALRLASPKSLSALAANARKQIYQPGDRVLTRGSPQNGLAFLAEGQLQLYAKSAQTGDQVLQALVSSPAIFGDAEHYSGLKRWAVSAKAATLLTVVWLLPEDFDALLAAEPKVAVVLYRNACWRLMMAVQLNLFNTLQPTHKKILQLMRSAARELPADAPVKLSTADIARSIGVNRKTVDRNLAAMEREGLLVARDDGWLLRDDANTTEIDQMGDRSSWRLSR